MTTITTSLRVNVEQGPQMALDPTEMNVEAYDKIDVSVGPGDDVAVDVQPGDTGVSFLLITSSVYTPADSADDQKLTYTPEGKATISLDAPQLYSGVGSIAALLGPVKKITFSNKLPVTPAVEAKPATETEPAVPATPEIPAPTAKIAILVGRDATP